MLQNNNSVNCRFLPNNTSSIKYRAIWAVRQISIHCKIIMLKFALYFAVTVKFLKIYTVNLLNLRNFTGLITRPSFKPLSNLSFATIFVINVLSESHFSVVIPEK